MSAYAQLCGGTRPHSTVGNYAAWRVQRAIRRGELTRPEVCSIPDCAFGGSIEAHHWHGYDEAHILDVQWLCVTHHRRLHKSGEYNKPAPLRQTGGAGPSLSDELRELGNIPVPSALIARTWLSVLAELGLKRCTKLSTAHPADADSPGLLGGITGRSSLLTPRCAPIRAAGRRRGAA